MNVRRVVTGPTPDGKTVAPQSATLEKDLDIPRALAELEAKLPGLASHMKIDNPGMHTTNNVDLEYVISGEDTFRTFRLETRSLGGRSTGNLRPDSAHAVPQAGPAPRPPLAP